MTLWDDYRLQLTRRHFLGQGRNLLGTAALTTLLGRSALAGPTSAEATASVGISAGQGGQIPTHFPPRIKNVIQLFMVGGPSQMDLYDYKPAMDDWYDKDLPESIRGGQRLTTMTSGQARFPIAPSMFKFKQCGENGMWVSDLLPHMQSMTDEIVFIRSMHTDAINHEPAVSLLQTGNQVSGRPCLGSWASYGLGSMNDNLPTFVVMVATPSNREQEQAISGRLWSAGYLPGEHTATTFRTSGDPILYIDNPPGVPAPVRRKMLDGLRSLNQMTYESIGDPETRIRIQQYELAYRMQSSVPELSDLSQETEATLQMYGPDVEKPGSFAQSVLLARRMVERGVRFVQIFHNNWDNHGNVAGRLPAQCRDVDQPCHALINDLRQRGLLDETLIIWGGEFGRTIYSQGGLSKSNYGRDHHPRCFTMWMTGGGTNGGNIYGETDDFSYNIVQDPVHVRDFHATVLKLLGYDHERMTYKYQGLDQRLTGVEPARVVSELLS